MLGAGGAFLEVKRHLHVGNSIGLRFVLPATGEEIVCGGVVRNHAREHGFGVEFTQLTTSDRELLTIVVLRTKLKDALRGLPIARSRT